MMSCSRVPYAACAAGGEVRFNGIKVGEVKTLRFDPQDATRVIARIQVSATTPVRTDSRARLEAVGLTGVTLIQLDAGTPSQAAPPATPGTGSSADLRRTGND